MGGLVGKNRPAKNDPFYTPVPPPGFTQPNVTGGFDVYDPYGQYVPTTPMGGYAEPVKHRANPYGGRYIQGLNQIPGVSPWNYGNYYLGNTTMQMMPMMLNKVHKFGQMQAMAALGNAGLLGSSPMMPNMLMNPCCSPPSFNMPMSAPMMAAATPLPVAFNPLVQGMYPMVSMNPVNWMSPASFMSALSSGPMPYRPPGFDFPSNVGMVMTIPYGTPNPMVSSPNFSSGFSCCCFPNLMPPATTAPVSPPITYYPQPVGVPQPYPVPYPVPYSVPAPIPNIQQVPVQHPVSVAAPSIVATGNQSLPVSSGAQLCPLHGVVTNANFSKPPVMASNHHSMTQTSVCNHSVNTPLPVYNATDPSQRLIGQPINTSNTSNIGSTTNQQQSITHSAAKNAGYLDHNHENFTDRLRRHLPSLPSFSRSSYSFPRAQPRSDPIIPPILNGQLISDSGWMPKSAKYSTITSLFSNNKRKRLNSNDINKPSLYSSSSRVSFIPYRRRRPHSSSSVSEYDCAICQEKRNKRRLRKYYDSPTVSSLLSTQKKHSPKHHTPSNASPFSSKSHTPNSMKHNGYKSHRRHPMKIKIKSRSPSPATPTTSTSPLLLGQTLLEKQRIKETIHETKEDETDDNEQEHIEKQSNNGSESTVGKPDQYQSKISLRSIDEETHSNH